MKPCVPCGAPSTHTVGGPFPRALCARCAERLDAAYDRQVAQIDRRRPRPNDQPHLDLGDV